MSAKSNLYKDDPILNKRTPSIYEQNLADLANGLKRQGTQFLCKNLKITATKTGPSHENCDYKPFVSTDKDTEQKKNRMTEKRICRCMNYYEKDTKKCKDCTLMQKYSGKGSSFSILDYEVPMDYATKSVGGIDLLVTLADSGTVYGTEVKPPKSKETLVRMIAEILTYTEGTKYSPAIAVFEGSRQEKDLSVFAANTDLQYLLELVTVFVIRTTPSATEKGVIEYEFIKV